MTPKTEGKEEKGPSGLPFINDPGNEDPGSLMDDAQVPLIEGEEVEDAESEAEEENEKAIDLTPGALSRTDDPVRSGRQARAQARESRRGCRGHRGAQSPLRHGGKGALRARLVIYRIGKLEDLAESARH